MTSFSANREYCKLELILELNSGTVVDMEWSPDGSMFAMATNDGNVRIFDTGKNREKTCLPHGLSLRKVSWTHDSRKLASTGLNGVYLWDAKLGEPLGKIELKEDADILCSDWSPVNGGSLACATEGKEVYLWNQFSNSITKKLIGHKYPIYCVKWSDDGKTLATGTSAGSIGIWREGTIDNQLRLHYHEHNSDIRCLAWKPNSHILASGSNDCKIHIRDTLSNKLLKIITLPEFVTGLTFDNSGLFLVAKCFDETIRIWQLEDYKLVQTLTESCNQHYSAFSSNPKKNFIATLDGSANSVRIWHIDFESIDREHAWANYPYRAAKAMLFGDSNSIRQKTLNAISQLSGCDFYCENRLSLGQNKVEPATGCSEVIEPILWNELHELSFAGIDRVRIKDAALIVHVIESEKLIDKDEQVLVSHQSVELAKKIGIPVLYLITDEFGFDNHQQTSIMEWLKDLGIANAQWICLSNKQSVQKTHQLIYKLIRWNSHKSTISFSLYLAVEEYYTREKENGSLVHLAEESYSTFLKHAPSFTNKTLSKGQFIDCLSNLGLAGKTHLFSFNSTLFLDPSLIYAYIDGMAKAASEDPLEMGRLEEARLTQVDFPIQSKHRIKNKHQEQLFILATSSMLEESSLVYKVSTGGGSYWVFPSELKRKTTLTEHYLFKDSEFYLDGVLKDAYSFVVTRLVGSVFFKEPELWENLALFKSTKGESCGLEFEATESGKGKFKLVYENGTSISTRNNFANFIRAQLESAPSISSILETKCKPPESLVTQNNGASTQTFICYNSIDVSYVRHIEKELKRHNLNVWYDEHMDAGDSILEELGQRITRSGIILVLLGANGLGKWQTYEYEAAVKQAIDRGGRIIPCLLPKYNDKDEKPLFLERYKHVDFRVFDPSPIEEIIRAVASTKR